MNWDHPINKKDIETWQKIIEETKDLSEIKVPRYIGTHERQLICFCDASENTYATAIYLKNIDNGIPKVNLIFAKARVAPKRVMSIPSLELMALLISVRCLNFAAKEMWLENTQRVVWTDSQFVMNSLTSKKPLSVFVQTELQESPAKKYIEFRYINTKENPANIQAEE